MTTETSQPNKAEEQPKQPTSRWTDNTIIKCYNPECNWTGPRRAAYHNYKQIPGERGEVEPVDECPRCCSEV